MPFTQLYLHLTPQPPTTPRERVRLPALKALDFDKTASACGLLDQLILPKCEKIMLKGSFTGKEFDTPGVPAARIHPSSIDHLPQTRGITRAVAMPNVCVLSGLNGCPMFWFFLGNRDNFDAEYFISFSPISVSEIRSCWLGLKPTVPVAPANLGDKPQIASMVRSRC